MDLTYPPEAEQFRTEIRSWLEENLPDGWFDEGFEMTPEQKQAFNDDWTTKLFEGGWICATWPEEYGGKGLDDIRQMIWYEEFARADPPFTLNNSCTFVGNNHGGPTLIVSGTDEQKSFHLPKILGGEVVWCQGFSEPGAGSDLANLSCKAVIDGDELDLVADADQRLFQFGGGGVPVRRSGADGFAQPAVGHLHENCSSIRTSLSKKRRRSGTPCWSIATRSIPS